MPPKFYCPSFTFRLILQLFGVSLCRKPLRVQLYKQLWTGMLCLILCGGNGRRTGTTKVWNKREMKRRKEGWAESGGGELRGRQTLDLCESTFVHRSEKELQHKLTDTQREVIPGLFHLPDCCCSSKWPPLAPLWCSAAVPLVECTAGQPAASCL